MLFFADKQNSWLSHDRRFRIQYVERNKHHSYEIFDRDIQVAAITDQPHGPSLSCAIQFCDRRHKRDQEKGNADPAVQG